MLLPSILRRKYWPCLKYTDYRAANIPKRLRSKKQPQSVISIDRIVTREDVEVDIAVARGEANGQGRKAVKFEPVAAALVAAVGGGVGAVELFVLLEGRGDGAVAETADLQFLRRVGQRSVAQQGVLFLPPFVEKVPPRQAAATEERIGRGKAQILIKRPAAPLLNGVAIDEPPQARAVVAEPVVAQLRLRIVIFGREPERILIRKRTRGPQQFPKGEYS